VWLKDPDDGTEHDEVGLQLVLTAGIEGAEMGIHVMRNVFCQFYNEKIEVLADRQSTWPPSQGVLPRSRSM